MNQIQEEMEKQWIKNRKIIEEAIQLDKEQGNDRESYEELLKVIQNVIIENNQKTAQNIAVIYSGNATMTVEIVLKTLSTNHSISLISTGESIAVNMIIVQLIELIANQYKKQNIIKFYHHVDLEKVFLKNDVMDRMIHIGDPFSYHKMKQIATIPVENINEGYLLVYMPNKDQYETIVEMMEMQAFEKDVEIEILETIEDVKEVLEQTAYGEVWAFCKGKEEMQRLQNEIKKETIHMNENPFGENIFCFHF